MRFVFGRQDFLSLSRAQESCFLLTNALGGYASLSAAFSVTRCDQGVLIGAVSAPNVRRSLVHRMSERLSVGGETVFLSSQAFAGRKPPEEGYRHLSCFSYEYVPEWTYHVRGVRVVRRMAMADQRNAAAVTYEIENLSGAPAALVIEPFFAMTPKGQARSVRTRTSFDGRRFCADGEVYITTDGEIRAHAVCWQRLAYPDDRKDGREESGLCASRFTVRAAVPDGAVAQLSIVFSMAQEALDAQAMIAAQEERLRALEARSGFADPVARRLALAADAYLSSKESTGGMTLLAGYPLFGDWGRDTMIALPGCALESGRLEEAKRILSTFLAYEKDGLVPNLFPEGGAQPMYNTADAALLLINAVWLYAQKTGDMAFVREAYPVMERIVRAYRLGTGHGIRMDKDGLIMAGEGLDQVTWMDVRIGDVLPTPRHGKPVEINAYWYSALRVMQALAPAAGRDGQAYGELASRVKASFAGQFYLKKEGFLCDVLTDGGANTQIRPNQIWAVTMPFTMLTKEQERRVVDTMYAHLYTPCGLRSLSPQDREYRGSYGGAQEARDLAYHQGTVWVFPLGAFYLAFLKTRGETKEAAAQVRAMLEPICPMLREGCVGQLPEIYEGSFPGESKGCFAQAWSVGEMLRVYAKLESIENKEAADA